MPQKLLYTTLLFLLSYSFFAQYNDKKGFSGGLNLNTSLSKLVLGLNTVYFTKNSTYFQINANIGITGYKKFNEIVYEKTDSFRVGNSNVFTHAYNVLNNYDTPYFSRSTINIPVNSSGFLNKYNAKIVGSFVNFSIGFPINKKKSLFVGGNTAYYWNTDKGNYTYTTIYPTTKRITKDINVKFQTYAFGFFFSYRYNFNSKIFLLAQLNSNFYFPLINENYGLGDGSNPLVGNEQDLSISINHKF